MKRSVTSLMLISLLITCNGCCYFCDKPSVCPEYPMMPQEVKDALQPGQSNAIDDWTQNLYKMKLKLDACHEI